MNPHPITDHELLLYHYRDGLDAAERARIAAALLTHPGLEARLQALLAQLDAAAAIPEVPVPVQAQQRWHAALDRAVGREAAAKSGARLLDQWRWPALAAVVIAALAAAFRLGVHSASQGSDSLRAANASRCECGLKWHLASVETQLAELSKTSGAQRAALIDAIVATNRIYAIAAERGGDQRLAGALRSFTLILEGLGRDADASRAANATVAQLNFELRVMQARLTAETVSAAAPAAAL